MLALMKLKLRIMKEYRVLYLVMIIMAIVLAGVFSSQQNNFNRHLLVSDDLPDLVTSAVLKSLQENHGYEMTLVPREDMVHLIESREALTGLLIGESLELVYLHENLEVLQLQRLIQSEWNHHEQRYALGEYIQDLLSSEGVLEGGNLQQWPMAFDHVYSEYWHSNRPASVELEISDTSYGGLFQTLQAVVGMTVFFVTYNIIFTVGDMLEDKRLRTMDRFFVAPLSKWALLIANLIPGMIIGMLQMGIMILSGAFLFGIDWGDHILAVLGFSLVYVFTITALSLFVVSLVDTQAQLGAFSPIILTGMAMLGGSMWPLEMISSKVLLSLASFTPHKWAIQGIRQIVLTGTMDAQITQSLLILIFMGIFYLILGSGILRYRWQK